MLVETDADGATESATVQESRVSSLQQCEKHGSVAPVQDVTEKQQCEMHGIAAAAQTSIEGALVSGKGSFSIENVSSLTGI